MKSIGWFDLKENAPGVLTSTLASEVQTLNGASTEGASVIAESFFALVAGLIIGFCYSWKITLVCLGCTPFLAAAGFING